MAGGLSELPDDAVQSAPPIGAPEAAAPDIGDAIARLSKLSEHEYEMVRRAEAKALGIRSTALDKMIRAKKEPDTASGNNYRPQPNWNAEEGLLLNPYAPLETARIIVEKNHMMEKQRTIHHQQSIFSTWTGTHYRDFKNEEMRAKLYIFLEKAQVYNAKKDAVSSTKPFNPTSKHVNETLDAMRAVCQIDATVRAPSWLSEQSPPPPPAKEIISCRNGLLHLPTGQMLPHTPNFYSTSSLEYDYDPDAPEPEEWFKFLASVWPTDIDARATVQEIFGYLLGTDTDQQKIPLIVGPKRSGKGTMARILTALVGPDAVVSPTLSSLETNFGAAPMIGKSIALIADARLGGNANQQRIAERLLSISGEDTQTIDRKHIDAWTGRLTARLFIMTNELPQISDASGALAGRFLIVTMTESFFGKEDHGLTNRLMAELPGILNWAIEGWRTLRARGYFIQPASSGESMRELEDLGSPISAFVRECCLIGPGKTVSVDGIFHAWQEWCEEQGRDHPGTKQTFGRNLKASVPGLKKPKQGRTKDDIVRNYEGIGLKQVNKTHSDEEHNKRFEGL